jgi:hypothetical protein
LYEKNPSRTSRAIFAREKPLALKPNGFSPRKSRRAQAEPFFYEKKPSRTSRAIFEREKSVAHEPNGSCTRKITSPPPALKS